MGWTTPRDFVAGEVVTAAIMNTHIRDQFLYLKGVGQVPTIQSGLTIDNSLGSERLLLPLLSTAECSTVLNAEGEIAFDELTHDVKWYNGSAIISAKDMATTKIASQAQGDLLYASSATAIARLAKGTALQVLKQNAGLTAPEWATITFASFLTWVNVGVTAITAVRYIPLGTGNAPDANEANVRVLIPNVATASRFYVKLTANTATGDSTIRLRKDGGVNTDLLITVGAGVTGTVSDLVHTAAISAGDLLSVSIAPFDGSLTVMQVSVQIA